MQQTNTLQNKPDTLPLFFGSSIKLTKEEYFPASFFTNDIQISSETEEKYEANQDLTESNLIVFIGAGMSKKIEVSAGTPSLYSNWVSKEPTSHLKSSLYYLVSDLSNQYKNDDNKTQNNLSQKYATKLVALEKKIGKDRFDRMTFQQQVFMANTFGSIYLGSNVNIQELYENIDNE